MTVVTHDTELSPSTCHHNFTQSGAHLSSTALMAVSLGSGSQQCALAGRPLVPPSAGYLCSCTVLTVQYTVHCTLYTVHCTAVQLIVLQCQLCRNAQHSPVHSQCALHTAQHCLALQMHGKCMVIFVIRNVRDNGITECT